jgi:hypothetical protein
MLEGIHAREWISPATVTYILDQLVENAETHRSAQLRTFYLTYCTVHRLIFEKTASLLQKVKSNKPYKNIIIRLNEPILFGFKIFFQLTTKNKNFNLGKPLLTTPCFF